MEVNGKYKVVKRKTQRDETMYDVTPDEQFEDFNGQANFDSNFNSQAFLQ